MRRLIGASILSAAGSLPLQILPFLVLTLVSEGRFDIAVAGSVGSAFLIGMLSSALLLPVLRVTRLNRWPASAALIAIVLSIALSLGNNPPLLFLALWYVVGFACGGLQFLGATTAAAAPNKPQAFALRLAVALIVASGVIITLAQFGGQGSYTTLAYFLMGAFGLAACIGLMLYLDLPISPPAAGGAAVTSKQRSWWGLFIVFAFFLGQPGFWAYAMQSASQRGLDLRDAAFVIAASKIVSALVLLWGSNRKGTLQESGLLGLLGLGLSIAAGIFAMSHSNVVGAFFIGFLIWEFALNLLSARLQGMVVAASPGHAGAWITGAILLGSATSPLVHGAAIGRGFGWIFLLYAALSALFPVLWAWLKSRAA